MRAGALIVADNADYSPEYLAHVRSPASGYLSIPFAGDVELSMRIGLVGPDLSAAVDADPLAAVDAGSYG